MHLAPDPGTDATASKRYRSPFDPSHRQGTRSRDELSRTRSALVALQRRVFSEVRRADSLPTPVPILWKDLTASVTKLAAARKRDDEAEMQHELLAVAHNCMLLLVPLVPGVSAKVELACDRDTDKKRKSEARRRREAKLEESPLNIPDPWDDDEDDQPPRALTPKELRELLSPGEAAA